MANETLPAKLSALPDAWIEKIFGQMEAMYGSLFLDRWRGTDLAAVKAVWAESLASFSDNPECFGLALKTVLDECRFPPTLPEFISICRRCYVPLKLNNLGLSAPEPLSRQVARDRLAEISRRFKAGPGAAA